MASLSIYKIYSKCLTSPELIITDQTGFNFHFAIFQSLRTDTPKLIGLSYTKDSIRSIGGATFNYFGPIIAAIVPQFPNACRFGEQSVWNVIGQQSEFTVFIEILDGEDTTLSRRCDRFKWLVAQYEHSLGNNVLLDANQQRQIQSQEIVDYACVIFLNHWVYENLDIPANLGWTIQNSNERAAVARISGSEACENLARFLNIVEEEEELRKKGIETV
ncbi:hypothetical protein BGZ60DRAFT_74601 [Tricladium varicosporioides]|nr:hypothetical protein BGZ60DRAFT_74601 [Hymenoscyphus varicosporioides]